MLDEADGRTHDRALGYVHDYIAYVASVLCLSENTVRAYGQHLHAFVDWCDVRSIDPLRVTVRQLRSYIGDMRSSGLSQRSVAAHLSSIRSFFRWMIVEGLIDSNPAEALTSPKLPEALPVTVSARQMRALFSVVESGTPSGLRDACMLELFYATGARISELASLRLDSFDWSSRCVRLFGKGSKERIVPVHQRAAEAVHEYVQIGRPALLSNSSHKRPLDTSSFFISKKGRVMDSAALRYRFKALSRRAGLPSDITPHTMRHTFATDLLDGGADLRSVQELLGHASLSTTQIYTHLSVDRMKGALKQAHPRGE